MIWLTWRQHRKQALFAVAGLAVLAAVLIPTGRQMYQALADSGLNDCLRKLGTAEFVPARGVEACDAAADKFNNAYGSRAQLGVLLVFLPLFAGLFWGAPLVAREVEHGTHRLVWTQGVNRLRWAMVKFGLVIVGVVVIAASYALLMSWWLTPLNRAIAGRLEPLLFDLQGLVPVGYTIFAVALGVFAGTVALRTLPAMAIALVGFLLVRIPVAILARPHFQAPLQRKIPVVGDVAMMPNRSLGDWVLSDGIYDGSGRLVENNATAFCDTPTSAAPGSAEYCHGPGAYNGWTYQPGNRFWLFQYIETGVFVALAVLLLYLALRRIRRLA